MAFDWAHIPEYINPVLVSFGQFKIYWYGLMYPIGFLTAFFLVIYRIRTEKLILAEDMVFDFALGYYQFSSWGKNWSCSFI